MNKIKVIKIFCVLSIAILFPSFRASEINNPSSENEILQKDVKYQNKNEKNVTNVVTFKDEGLEAAIADKLGVNVGEITIGDMTRLDTFTYNYGQLTDITGLETAINLRTLDLSNNSISDITALANLSNLTSLNLSKNKIIDISPLSVLFNQGNLDTLNIINQTIYAPEVNVSSKENVTFNVVDIDGNKVPVSLGRPYFGNAANLSGVTYFEFGTNGVYSANISQTVTYLAVSGKSAAAVNEETILTNDQLIQLFNVENREEGKDIEVDQSTVDYSVPGTYNVKFFIPIRVMPAPQPKNGKSVEIEGINQIEVTLTVNDLLPTIETERETVKIKLGDTLNDYLVAFGASATEIEKGDLTSSINIDDSAVDYTKSGVYKVIFNVADQEGNLAKKIVKVEILLPEEKVIEKSEIEPKEVEKSKEKKNIATETKSNTNTEVTEQSEVVKKMNDGESKKKLTTTGGFESLSILLLTTVSVILLFVRSKINKA